MTGADCATPLEMQHLLGISYDRLHGWLDRGIVVASKRTAGGHRRFTARDQRRVRLAARLKREGASTRQLARFVPALHEETERMIEVEVARRLTAAVALAR